MVFWKIIEFVIFHLAFMYMWAVEVWTGSRWLTLGMYLSERSALRRMDQSVAYKGEHQDEQERRVRMVGENEALRHKALSCVERRKRKRMWG